MKRLLNMISKHILLILLLSFIAYNTNSFAQEGNKEKKPNKQEETTLTEKQIEQVKSILSNYNSSKLTSDDAIKINDSFRNAGVKNGPTLHQVIREAGFDPEELGRLAPKPGKQGEGNKDRKKEELKNKEKRGNDSNYSIEQAISDRAQLHTIAFDALAFITGNICGDSFLPPGKVSDFFGFQYLRDTDQGEMGHNTSFVPRSANNVLYVLNDNQINQLIELAKSQEKLIQEFAYKRFPLLNAFRRLQSGDIPTGKSKLSLGAVKEYSAQLYEIDGLLSYQRAEVLGSIIRSFSNEQKVYLDNMKTGNSTQWPEKQDQLDKRKYSHEVHVAVMTYASELFSWYAGSVEADTYFCPERHGMYFGSFYMKDIPAMGNKDYSISTELTGNKGEDFLNSLNNNQKEKITSLIEIQRESMQEIVEVRRKISTELRKFMKQESINKDLVLKLSKRYGELDGEISYRYAIAFSNVYKTLSDNQLKKLNDLRDIDEFPCRGAYIYSQNIKMPEIENTDYLFE